MFDNVGRNQKQNAGRSAGSLVLSLVLNGGALGGMAWLTTAAVENAEEIKEVLTVVDLSPPPPPPPPPPAGGGKKKKEKKVEETPKEEVPVEPTVLEEKVEEPPVEEDEGEGDPAGVEGGVKDGVAGGTVGGVKDGVLGGELGGTGIKTVHWSEVQVKTRVKPRFPEAAKQLGLKEEKCIVHIVVNEQGKASDVSFKACPELFREAAAEAARNWEWYPLTDGGQPIRAQFDISFVFKLT
ncbi:MAG: energy transducer TonB [Deltaproteobacteria bacterium]|nr:energy transducer TonB [Deltaproteobacteria bacterium]